MADRSVVVKLRAETSQYVAGLKQAETATTRFGDEVQKKGKSSRADIERLGTAGVVAGGLLVGALGGAAFKAAGFEKAMSGVKAVSGASADEMKTLSDAALAAGASVKLAGVTAMDAANAEAELVKAGVSVADVTGGALMGSLQLAAAGQLDFADAATIAAQAMNIFHLQGSDVSHVADLLAAAANKSAGDVSGFGDALRQGGLVAQQTGLTLDETVATLAAFADNALIGSDAGTSLKTMLQRLSAPTKESADLMKKLGISAYDASGNFVGLDELAGQLHKGFGSLTDAQRNQAEATIFGSDAVRAANVLFEQGADGMRDYEKAVDDQGAAARMAAMQNDNLKGDIEALGGALESALIQNGSKATGALRSITQEATDFVGAFSTMPDIAQSATLGLSGLVGITGLVGGGFVKMAPEIRASKEALEAMDSSLANFAGRNLGAISGGLAGLTAAIGAGIWIYGKATEASRDYKAQVEELGQALKPVVDGQSELNDVITEFFKAQAEGLSKGSIDALNALGVKVDDIQASISKGGDALDPMREALKRMGYDLDGLDFGKLDDPAHREAMHDLAKRLGVSDEALRSLIDTTEDWDNAAQEQSEQTVKTAQANDIYSDSAVNAAVKANTAADGAINWVGVLADLAPGIEDVGTKADTAASGGVTNLATAEDEAATKSKELKDAIDNLFKPLDAQSALDKFATDINNMGDAFADADSKVGQATGKLADAQQALADLQSGKAVADAKKRLAGAQQDLSDLMGVKASDRDDSWKRRVQDAKDRIVDAQEAVQDATTDTARKIEDAKQRVADAQKDLQDAIAETSRSMDGNSDAAIRNRDMLSQAAKDAAAAVQAAMEDQSNSGEDVIAIRDRLIAQIETEAEKVGLTKEAVKQYTDVLRNIPIAITTDVTLNITPTVGDKFDQQLDDAISNYQATHGVKSYAAGGPVYAARGRYFEPRGTDTVPAMLTPGEGVVNVAGMSRLGVAGLNALNSGRLQSAGGGMSDARSWDNSRTVHQTLNFGSGMSRRDMAEAQFDAKRLARGLAA